MEIKKEKIRIDQEIVNFSNRYSRSNEIIKAFNELKQNSNEQITKKTIMLLRSIQSSISPDDVILIPRDYLFKIIGNMSCLAKCMGGSDNITELKTLISFIKTVNSIKNLSTKMAVTKGVSELIFELHEDDSSREKLTELLKLINKTFNSYINSINGNKVSMEYALEINARTLPQLVNSSESPELQFNLVMANLPDHIRNNSQNSLKLRTEKAHV